MEAPGEEGLIFLTFQAGFLTSTLPKNTDLLLTLASLPEEERISEGRAIGA